MSELKPFKWNFFLFLLREELSKFWSNLLFRILEYFSKRNGYGYATDKKSTHPGYEDRRKNIVEFLDKNRKAITTNLYANTKGYWRFNRKENTLTYFIKNRYLPDQMKVDEAAKNFLNIILPINKYVVQ